jgi:hypothetical protein
LALCDSMMEFFAKLHRNQVRFYGMETGAFVRSGDMMR